MTTHGDSRHVDRWGVVHKVDLLEREDTIVLLGVFVIEVGES